MGLRKNKFAEIRSRFDELESDKNLMMLENASLDFMVSNDKDFDVFRNIIKRFKIQMSKRKRLIINNDSGIVLTSYGSRTAKGEKVEDLFSENIDENNYMHEWVKNVLDQKVPLEILNGIIINKESGKYKTYYKTKNRK